MTSVKARGARHDELMPLLEAMFREFQDAAKKKPDGALNKKKVQIVNRLLESVFEILDGEVSRSYLDLLDEDDLPQNSDVVLMLGQAVAAMKAFHKKNYGFSSARGAYGWGLRAD
ncbi:hypothetical protein [Pseudoxanthomonas japonensis]|uniref:Uncharacterized protein n=1 Tax=Pseudoxanthomonas japonensis TaxID=69284 RepID=A0ABQ6ZHS9_9GAMM|nr:hypothetical protein [Pseudoxanthomonas japonensis]KAF1725500.1 hypothetical protein CSC78_08525 [Pseudoxanthomonas japonensis]